jgi:predicted nucleic acid-binding protein
MQDYRNLDKEIVMDTCYLVQSCSTIGDKERPPDGYSQIDNEVREKNLSPKDLRQEIENLILSDKLLIAEIVVQELKDFLLESCKKLNQKNRNRLSHLLQRIKGKIVDISIGTNEYNLQKEIFNLIETTAQERIKKIEKKTNSNLSGWEKTKGPKSNIILKEVYADPICKTWQKICQFKDAVVKTAEGIKNHKPFLLNDFLIILTAKKRKALIKTNDGDIRVILTAYNQVLNQKEMSNANESNIN